MTRHRFVAAASLLAISAGAHAIDFKAVGPAPVILYDAPSQKGNKLYIAPRGMPVEVVLTYGDWSKVRDYMGDLAWTETRNLSGKRALVVRNPKAAVHAEDNEDSAVLYTADRGVILELADPQVSSWVKVRHHDGTVGYIKAQDVWGI
ncbi:MAG: SH3 domain-containing protein [Telluria sp.]